MTGKAPRPAQSRPAPPEQTALPQGERVYLRALARSDAAAFVAAAKASRLLHRPWVHPPATVAEFARRMTKKSDDANWIALLAVRRGDDALLGALNLSEIIRGPLQQSFLGYYAFAPHSGHGYMREALRLVLDYAFRKLKLHRVEANIQPGNRQSIALASACGFAKEGFSARYLKIDGRWRDHERWAINADDWRRRRLVDKRAP